MQTHLRPPGPHPERLGEPRPPPESYLPAHLRAPPRQPAPFGGAGAESPSAFPSRGFTAHAVQRLLADPGADAERGAGVADAERGAGGADAEGGAAREEGGVFGGLVSYFSSQHEAEMDA